MTWFRRKETATETYGWRINTRRNDALDKTVYRVYKPGFITRWYSERPEWQDFDNYDDALAYYHEKTGWATEKVEQP